MKKLAPIFFCLLIVCLLYYLPVLINPSLVLNRGNDLDGFFWPILFFVKNQLISHHSLPLWNNLFLSGAPLLPDPQAPIFYPLNLFALIIPLDSFYLFSFILHTFLGGVGLYLCSKYGFKFSTKTSLFLSFLYLTSPKLAGYLTAGHVGLVYSLAWIPYALWASLKLRGNPNLKYSLLFGVALSLLYFSHLPTFIIISFVFGFLALKRKSVLYVLISAILTLGLTAVSLFPQIEWQKYSTRYLLLANHDVYPKWTSPLEPIKAALLPWRSGISAMQKIDSEKLLALGLIPVLLAAYGFWKLKLKLKFLTIIVTIPILLIVLNNSSPIHSLLLKQDWYLLLRVSTRFWILIVLLTLYLAGVGLERLRSKVIYGIFTLAILESIAISWLFLSKPITQDTHLAPPQVYEYLSSDQSRFRVFCLTRCLSQKMAAVYNLELLDGYNTIQQKNFYQEAWQLTGTYWNEYTLSIPPLGTFTEKLNPDPKSLGKYNVKYVISPYPLIDKNFKYIKLIDKFYIYENKLLLPRANGTIEIYQPNFIKIKTDSANEKQLILAEVYSPGWKAYLNGDTQTTVQETPDALRAVDLKPGTKFVDLKYLPTSYQIGKVITLATLLLIIGYGLYTKTKKST
jgi:hypothetical protein